MRKGLVMSAVGALAGGVLVAVPLLASGAAADEVVVEPVVVGAAAETPTDNYVAFGDSFVSGPGIAPQHQGPCARSEVNFPSLVADGLDAAGFVDVSCSGAETVDLFEPQKNDGGVELNEPQLDVLNGDTSLITFGTLGGNDMGLVGLAMFCVTGKCGPGENPVDGQMGSGDTAALAGIETARDNMIAGLQQAKALSPDAEIHVIGYSTYLPPGGCAGLPGMDADEADYLQGMIDNLSDMLGDVAEQENVEFVDMREIPGVEEHTACAEPKKQWIRAVNTYDDGSMFHPSACGMDASAQHILNAIRANRGEAEVPFDDSCVSAGPAEPTSPTVKERKQALKKALRTTKLKTNCRAGKVTVKVKGGNKQVNKVVFKLGKKKLKTDKQKPFKVTKKATKLRKHRGKVKAVVQVRDAELRLRKTLKKKRPGCI